MDQLYKLFNVATVSVPKLAILLVIAAAALSITAAGGLVPYKVSLARLSSGLRILLVFAAIVLIFAILAAIRYWPDIMANQDLIYYGIGLFLAMCAGMFVRVMAANHQAGRPFYQVDAATLLFPLLFSLIVFYPIWALAAQAPRGLFSIYAAFLNGFFWESIVSGVKPPATGGGAGPNVGGVRTTGTEPPVSQE